MKNSNPPSLGGVRGGSQELITYLSEFITPERFELFNRIASERTKYATIVIEDLYQPHNISAVLRSCDCFGVQDIHVIENRNEYEENQEIAMGANKWLDVKRYPQRPNNTVKTLQELKSEGYRIIATTPHTDDVALNDFDVTKGKFAMVFGNEKEGISDNVKSEADEFLRIPMYGFTESFNISVSAALCLQYVANAIRKTNVNWQLSQKEHNHLILKWLRAHIKNVEMIEDRYFEGNNK